jgi:serine/threonine protein phosphatase 1
MAREIAIGDIHGCSRSLGALIQVIQPGPSDTIVTLGDYIDWGPDSRGVLDQLITLGERCTFVPLRGNHEEMLLAAREGQSDLQFWLKFGGRATRTSYGLGEEPKSIPPDHIRFFQCCRDYFESLRHIYVHAYYESNVLLHQQNWNALRWASLPATPVRHCSGKIAIVGHTPQKTGEVLDMCALKCIDTFCHGGGWLTALEVNTGQVWQANQAGELRRPPGRSEEREAVPCS